MPNRSVRSILYRPIRLDIADGAVRSVLDSAIRFNVRHSLVIAVRDPLGIGLTTEQRNKGYRYYEQKVFHF